MTANRDPPPQPHTSALPTLTSVPISSVQMQKTVNRWQDVDVAPCMADSWRIHAKILSCGVNRKQIRIADQEVKGHACESWTTSAWYGGSSLSSCLALGANMDLQFTYNKNQILVPIAVVIEGPLRVTMM